MAKLIPLDELDDIEIVATAIRLTRGASPGTKGKDIHLALQNEYPDVHDIRIKAALRAAADRLLEQHRT